jgi:hypothetical protein
MKQTGDEMRAEPAFAGLIVSPIEIAGVDRVSEAGVLLKARIRTNPGKQWTVQRDYLRRIRLAFARDDIEFSQSTTRLIAPEPLAAPHTDKAKAQPTSAGGSFTPTCRFSASTSRCSCVSRSSSVQSPTPMATSSTIMV